MNSTSNQVGLVWQNIENALNAVVGANGQITCAPGYKNAAIATLSSTCAPLNIFGTGNVSQAALNYINAPAISRQVNKQFDAIVDIKGSLAHLPAGDLNAVIGGEIRRESQAFDPGAFFAAPIANMRRSRRSAGPITRMRPLPRSRFPPVAGHADSAAARTDPARRRALYDNSLNGGFWSYTGGGNWSPLKG